MQKRINPDIEYAIKLDKNDPLKKFRNCFYIADKNTIYLDGNSLGRLPLKTKSLISEITENQWGKDLIESWNKNWYHKSTELGNKIAKIIGASPGEVIVSDSTSLNLYKLAKAALNYQKNRTEVVSDIFNFPTDLYILQGILKEMGSDYKLVLAGKEGDIAVAMEDLTRKISEKTALVVLSMVSFKSSFYYNAAEISKMAHKNGALVLWDLSHAAGAVPVEINKINADLAVGCSYKYLNGGPGAPAFLYVNKKLQEKLETPLQGWFGDERPFAFDLNYSPASGIQKFLVGTPPVISQLAIEPGLDLLIEAGINMVREKSVRQTEYFIQLTEEVLSGLEFKTASPLKADKRGSHISLQHAEAYRICQALINPGNKSVKIIPDFRDPDLIRFGFAPLYTTFNEIWQTVYRMKQIMKNKEFLNFSNSRGTVT